jgi:mannosyl-oligosaccharide alpha-1,2-mannosidase
LLISFPETIESVFYYYRMTGEKKYQDLAWRLFSGVDRYARVDDGFTIVNDVDKLPIQLQDFQERYYLSKFTSKIYALLTPFLLQFLLCRDP